MKHHTHLTFISVLLMVFVSLTIMALAQNVAYPYVIRATDGEPVRGETLRIDSSGTAILTRKGTSPISMPKGTYTRAVNKTPDNWVRAVKALESRDYDTAIREFGKIVRSERNLTWDELAMPNLAKAYLGKGQPDEVIKQYKELFRHRKDLEYNAQVTDNYNEALLQLQNFVELEERLKKVLETTGGYYGLKAQIMRGDIMKQKSRKQDALEEYLRAVVFFKGQPDAAPLMPEALFKVAMTMEELRDPRNQDFYRMLIATYPQSREAQTARTKL